MKSNLVLLTLWALLSGCSALPFWQPAPYNVTLRTFGDGVFAHMDYCGRRQTASGITVYSGEACSFPESVTVDWSTSGWWSKEPSDKNYRAILPVKAHVPENFKRGDEIEIAANSDGTAFIEFHIRNANTMETVESHRYEPVSIERLADSPCRKPLSGKPCTSKH